MQENNAGWYERKSENECTLDKVFKKGLTEEVAPTCRPWRTRSGQPSESGARAFGGRRGEGRRAKDPQSTALVVGSGHPTKGLDNY